jgi:hypothetical protein
VPADPPLAALAGDEHVDPRAGDHERRRTEGDEVGGTLAGADGRPGGAGILHGDLGLAEVAAARDGRRERPADERLRHRGGAHRRVPAGHGADSQVLRVQRPARREISARHDHVHERTELVPQRRLAACDVGGGQPAQQHREAEQQRRAAAPAHRSPDRRAGPLPPLRPAVRGRLHALDGGRPDLVRAGSGCGARADRMKPPVRRGGCGGAVGARRASRGSSSTSARRRRAAGRRAPALSRRAPAR